MLAGASQAGGIKNQNWEKGAANSALTLTLKDEKRPSVVLAMRLTPFFSLNLENDMGTGCVCVFWGGGALAPLRIRQSLYCPLLQ